MSAPLGVQNLVLGTPRGPESCLGTPEGTDGFKVRNALPNIALTKPLTLISIFLLIFSIGNEHFSDGFIIFKCQ